MSDGESHTISSPTTSITEDVSKDRDSHGLEIENQTHEALVDFDLSDPVDIETKINDLTDEEIEELLKQAYLVNGELQRELDRKEREKSGGQRGETSGAASATHLPPLKVTSSKTHRRGFTSLGHHQKTSNKLYSSPVSSNRQKAKTALTQPTKPKPEWNDRFGI